MTEADLGVKSIPRNSLLFALLHRMEAVENIGSGIRRIRNLCKEYGVAEPKIEVSEHWFTMTFLRSAGQDAIKAAKQVTEQVTEQVVRLLSVLGKQTMSGQELMDAVSLQHRPTFLYS